MIIFSIETSCDDTSVAVVKTRGKTNPRFEILSNIVSSQIKDHAKFGGIVPNLAARLHLENINICIDKALSVAGISPSKIDLITVTRGPGLIPALLIGTQVARTLSYLWKKPIIGVNHMEGHIYANWINEKSSSDIKFPILNLVVSGGHTMLVLMEDHFKYNIVGQTRDDAVGESFDKVARLLNLGYPGGPIIEKLAKKYKGKKIDLPRPMMHSKDFDFSFSGLKTAVLYEIRKRKRMTSNFQEKMSASFQQSAIDVLIYKTIKASKEYGAKTVMLSGGVSANKTLQAQFEYEIKKNIPNTKFIVPDIGLSTDNAVMIAIAGFYRYNNGELDFWKKIKADPNLSLA